MFKIFRIVYNYLTNKRSRKLIYDAATGFDFDYSYLLALELDKLRNMRDFIAAKGMSIHHRYTAQTIDRAIRVLEAYLNKDTFTYHCKTDIDGNAYWGEGEYKCLVNVNLKNIHRFIKHPDAVKYAEDQPHELYHVKALSLYHKLREHYMATWWD